MSLERQTIASGQTGFFQDDSFESLTSESGGAISNQGLVETKGILFYGNAATASGGAIYNGGTATIQDSLFTLNSASTAGAVFNGQNAVVTISNSNFTNNRSTTGGAGVIYCSKKNTVSVSGSTFSANGTDKWGGVILLLSGTSTLTGSTFSGNGAELAGGAVYSSESLNFIDSCVFTGNSSGSAGGALYDSTNNQGSTISNSTFSGNSCHQGGALSLNGTVTILDSVFQENTAIGTRFKEAKGGAIYNSREMTIGNSRFAGNYCSEYGGAIYGNYGHFSVTGSTFTGNSAGQHGGAVSSVAFDDDASLLDSVLFDANSADGNGGALYNISDGYIINGCTFSGNSAGGEGGAIGNLSGTTVSSAAFSGNAAFNGGAVSSNASDAKYGAEVAVVMTKAQFTANTSAWNGGALYNKGACYRQYGNPIPSGLPSEATLDGAEMAGNHSGGSGGAAWNDSVMTIRNSSVSGNTALADGGAVCNTSYATAIDLSGRIYFEDGVIARPDWNPDDATVIRYESSATLDGDKFGGNCARNGGAVYNCAELLVDGCEFAGNTASEDGGAVNNGISVAEITVTPGNGGGELRSAPLRAAWTPGPAIMDVQFAGSAEIIDSTLRDNLARRGGAIFAGGNGITVKESVFYGNHAEAGGGIYVPEQSEVLLSGCTFSGNTAGEAGGAIYNLASVKVDDTTFATETDSVCNEETAEFYGDNVLNSRLHGGGTSYSGENTSLTGNGTVAQRYIAQGYETSWDGVALDATMIGGKVGEAVGGVELNFNSVSMSADSLVFGAGECTDGDIDMGEASVRLCFTGTGTREKAYIYAGGHADGDSRMNVGSAGVSCDVTGDMGALWGGALLENGGSFAADEVTTEISGGRFLSYVGNGCKTVGGASSSVNTEIGAAFLSISGGSFTNLVYAGGYSNGGGVTVGNSTLEISGGTFDKSVFGGNGADCNANGTNTTVTGNVYVTVDSSDGNSVSFGSNLYGGSMGEGGIVGTTTMTFTGLGENLSFSKSSYVSGGSKLAYHYAYAQKTFVNRNADRDARFLVFDGFSGDFGANMNNGFSNVSFVNGSSGIEFTGGSVDLRYTKVWDFEIGGDGTILDWKGGMNDFAGDSLNISFGDGYALDSTPAVLLAGDAGTLNGWRNAEMITLGGSAMADDDGDGVFTGSCAGVDYRLYEDAENRLTLAVA